MMEWLQRLVARLMNRVRVNQVRQVVQDGVPLFLKRRRVGGSIVIWFGNRFLALARSGACMFVRVEEWVDWEIHCARLLYPERPAPTVGPGQSVISRKVSGTSVRTLLQRDDADVSAFVAAARELRRVHQIHCSYYESAWSHGDLHLDNIVYDDDADRAVLIDFDARHELHLHSKQRHSDDLKVMLLELMGLPQDKWTQLATAFLAEYHDSSVLGELRSQLFVPSGFARILLFTRSTALSAQQIEQRFQDLRAIIDRTIASASVWSAEQFSHNT